MREAILLFVAGVSGLATGALMVNWIGLARAMVRLTPSTYVELHQRTNETFDPYMPILIVTSLVGGLIVAFMYGFQTLPGRLALAGSVGFATVMAIGLPTCVRINHQIARWSLESPPENWRSLRARWVKFHVLRTVVSLPALACYMLALRFAAK